MRLCVRSGRPAVCTGPDWAGTCKDSVVGPRLLGIPGSILVGEQVAPEPESWQVLWELLCDHSDVWAVAGSRSLVWLDVPRAARLPRTRFLTSCPWACT